MDCIQSLKNAHFLYFYVTFSMTFKNIECLKFYDAV